MAYQRLSDVKIKGDGLDAFVENTMKLFSRQLSVRNADDEARFNRLVLDQNLSIEGYRMIRKKEGA
jgi:hypothetical protein